MCVRAEDLDDADQDFALITDDHRIVEIEVIEANQADSCRQPHLSEAALVIQIKRCVLTVADQDRQSERRDDQRTLTHKQKQDAGGVNDIEQPYQREISL